MQKHNILKGYKKLLQKNMNKTKNFKRKAPNKTQKNKKKCETNICHWNTDKKELTSRVYKQCLQTGNREKEASTTRRQLGLGDQLGMDSTTESGLHLYLNIPVLGFSLWRNIRHITNSSTQGNSSNICHRRTNRNIWQSRGSRLVNKEDTTSG